MVYVTGDTHGDLARMKSKGLQKLRKGDTLVVCGDFGFVWDGSKKEQKVLRWLGQRKYKLLFVDGTHDNPRLLAQYPEVEFCGGRARQISGNLYYLCRGEIFTIEGKRIFAMGGSESPDMDVRIPGVSWWEEEMPTPAEMEAARARLRAAGDAVDFIVTHDCATSICDFINMDANRVSQLNAFFERISGECRFTRWFFGCYHEDKRIPASYVALYRSVVPME